MSITTEDIYAACKDASVTIRSEEGYCGSGFIVKNPDSEERYVLTAAHLMEHNPIILQQSGSISGTVVPHTLPVGENLVYFEYLKNNTGSAGSDGVTIDNLVIENGTGNTQLSITFDGLSGTEDPIAGSTGELVTAGRVTWFFDQYWENDGTGVTTTQFGDNNYALCYLSVDVPDDGTMYTLTLDYTVDSEPDHDFFSILHYPLRLQFVQKATVYIENVNGTGVHKELPAVVVGIDGRNDVAVLRLAKSDETEYEDLLEHPYIEFGDSLRTRIGERIWMVGDPLAVDYRSIAAGIVRDNKFIDDEHAAPETVWLDCGVYPGNSGSMVVNARNKVVSMLTWSFGDNSSGGGPPQFLIEKTFRYILAQYAAQYPSGPPPPTLPPFPIMYPKAFLGLDVFPLLLIMGTLDGVEDDVRGLRIVSPPLQGTALWTSLLAHSPPITLNVGDVIVWMAFHDGSGTKKITFGTAEDQFPLARVLWEAEERAAASADGVFRVHLGYREYASGYAHKTATHVAIFSSGEIYPPNYDLPLAYGPMSIEEHARFVKQERSRHQKNRQRIQFSSVLRSERGTQQNTRPVQRPVYL